jgi:hypothetical protein
VIRRQIDRCIKGQFEEHLLFIPLITEFATEKLELRTEVEKLSDPIEASRLASIISTSAEELTLVGTFGVRAVLESAGKTRYTSTITFLTVAPDGTKPVKLP